MVGEGNLEGERRGDGVGGPVEDQEEAVSLAARADQTALVPVDDAQRDGIVLLDGHAHPGRIRLPAARAALNVGKHE